MRTKFDVTINSGGQQVQRLFFRLVEVFLL